MGSYQVETEHGTYQIDTDDGENSSGVGQGVTGQKGSKLEEAISPTGGEDNFLTSPHGFIRSGARQIVHGIGEVMHPGQRMQGASDVIRGGMSMVTPAAIPLAVANPVTAAIGLGSGVAAGKLAHSGIEAMGGDEGAQNLGEDVAGIAGGSLAGGLAHPRLSPSIGTGLKVAAPKLAGGGAMIAAGEGLAKVPGMEWPARIGLGYPGARQIGHGLQEGFEAGRSKFRELKPVAPPQGPSDKWSGGPASPPPPAGTVGPMPKPTLPSGRKVGGIGAQAGPVAAPGGVGPGNAAAPPSTPIEAANKDTHLPGVTQADEFKGSVVPPPTPSPQGTGNSVQDPRLSRSSIQKHLDGIAKKTENVKAYAADPAHQITVEELEALKNDLTQADDPAKYHAAIQKAKTMGKEVYAHAKGRGAPIPDSPYRTFSLDDIDTAIKHLKASQ